MGREGGAVNLATANLAPRVLAKFDCKPCGRPGNRGGQGLVGNRQMPGPGLW